MNPAGGLRQLPDWIHPAFERHEAVTVADLTRSNQHGFNGVRGRAPRSANSGRHVVWFATCNGVLGSDGHRDENAGGRGPLPTRRIGPTARRAPGRCLPNSNLAAVATFPTASN
jgi:hypothetical protein